MSSSTYAHYKTKLSSGHYLQVDFPSSRCVRIRVSKTGNFPRTKSAILVDPDYSPIPCQQRKERDVLTFFTPELSVHLDSRTGQLRFTDATGAIRLKSAYPPFTLESISVHRTIMDEDSLLLTETADGERAIGKVKETVFDRNAFRGQIRFALSENEALYGLGCHEESNLNLRGTHQYLYQHNLKACVPTLISTKAYGLLFHAECAMEFDDRGPICGVTLDTVDEIDFFFYLGRNADEVVEQYRLLTGRASMMPSWLFGYCQSKERYKTQDEIVAVAREFRQRRIPIDLIVQDWHYWPDGWGGKHFDASRYPDPGRLCSDIHDLGMRVMISIWPNMMDGKNRPEMIAAGKMLNDHTIYDAFDPAARDLYWKQAEEGIFRYGFDAWWCDSTEPYIADWYGPTQLSRDARAELNIAEFKRHIDAGSINAYSLYHSQGIYENQCKARPNARVVNLTRSAYAGQQRFGTITWPGDPSASWETLAQNIGALLNFSASGCPWVTMDIGAFFVRSREQWFWRGEYPGGVDDLGYRELYTRWLQFGAFTPMMRSHGTDTPREPWHFGEAGTPFYDVIIRFIELRYHLLPYIYSLAAACHYRHYTLMRPLAFDFPEDVETHAIADQYLFGPALMVCPVVQPMYYRPGSQPLEVTIKTRQVYLPRGSDWCDFWTGLRYKGGQSIKADAELERMPIFARAGSIIPVSFNLRYTKDLQVSDVDALVFSGRDGEFTLYSDDGDTTDYLAGGYSSATVVWEDNQRQLKTVSKRLHDNKAPAIRRAYTDTGYIQALKMAE